MTLRLAVLLLLLSPAAGPAQACCDVKVPAPFEDVEPAALVRLLYPEFDPAQGTLGPGLQDEEGNALGGQLYDAKPWKAEGETKLVITVETYGLENGQRPEYGAAYYGVDLALVERTPGGVRLAASSKTASNHGGHGAIDLDLAPYQVMSGSTAIGLRGSSMHMGFAGSELQLFVREGSTFRKVFERIVAEDNTGMSGDELEGDLTAAQMKETYQFWPDSLARRSEAILQMVPGRGERADVKVVIRTVQRKEAGGLQHDTSTEVWSWDSAAREYRKRP